MSATPLQDADDERDYYRCCRHCILDAEGCIDWPRNGKPGHFLPCDEDDDCEGTCPPLPAAPPLSALPKENPKP